MCVNNNCDKNPLNILGAIVVNYDGDFACDEYCKHEYEKQRDHFFNIICESEQATEQWLLGFK